MVRRPQAADRVILPNFRSPGSPKFQRPMEFAFWQQMAKWPLAEESAGIIGVAQAVGARPFNEPHSPVSTNRGQRRRRPHARKFAEDPVLRARVLADLGRSRAPNQIAGRLRAAAHGPRWGM